ncbi:MAG: segregation/condensation protein A [Candidatus Marinimicrobia bacterium]|nr:segregation/condensation protein A [Candidatus Neomarinimicrobiota bacterium]|tara:strand:+ start:7087 stop:7806 length:720 start_codon:yes stop_codon:yes gene_type:complete
MSYEIKLEQFEGPLDLLLFFIHRDKINIYDIPISHITQEFLEYSNMMGLLRIDMGGEFILMAAMLMQIKAKLLLPQSNELDEDGEILDPRIDLVQKLIEYKQYKNSAETFRAIHETHSQKYERGQEISFSHQQEDMTLYVQDVSLFNLISMFKELIENQPEVNPYKLQQEEINVHEQVELIRSFFSTKKKFYFSDLGELLTSKLRIVVTFMALLEMLKNGEIDIHQSGPFSKMKILKAA